MVDEQVAKVKAALKDVTMEVNGSKDAGFTVTTTTGLGTKSATIKVDGSEFDLELPHGKTAKATAQMTANGMRAEADVEGKKFIITREKVGDDQVVQTIEYNGKQYKRTFQKI